MLLILSLAFAFFSWPALAAAEEAVAASTPADNDGDCISAHHLLSLSQTLSWLHLNSSSTELAVELPVIPDKYIVSPTACVPNSLYQAFVGPVVQVAKDRQLVSKMDELLAVTPAVRTPRGVMTGRLEKRIRKCPEVRKDTSCLTCVAKMNQESMICCAAAAAAFASYYTQVCMYK